MRAKITAFLGIALLILLISALSTSTVFAEGATEDTAKIVAKNGSGKFKVPVGDATLTLTLKNGELKIEAATTRLEPEHAFSVWGIVNDEPAFNLTGFISDVDGKAGFSGTAHLGNLELDKFVIKIKDHGQTLENPNDIRKQKSTKDFNCDGSCPTIQKAVFDLS